MAGAYCRAHRETPLDTDTLLADAILIEHIVRLVNDQDLELNHVELTAPDGIHDDSWRSDDDVGIDTGLSVNRTWNSGGDVQTRTKLADVLKHALDLTSQLPTWARMSAWDWVAWLRSMRERTARTKAAALRGPSQLTDLSFVGDTARATARGENPLLSFPCLVCTRAGSADSGKQSRQHFQVQLCLTRWRRPTKSLQASETASETSLALPPPDPLTYLSVPHLRTIFCRIRSGPCQSLSALSLYPTNPGSRSRI